MINAGSSERFELVDDLCLARDGGRARLALFRAAARPFPFKLVELERHCLGSQTFLPLGELRFVVVVALGAEAPELSTLAAFLSNGRQGISLAPGIWHHALLAVDAGDFIVVERGAEAIDCDLARLARPIELLLQAD